jgi:hypothetical protein
MLEAIEKGRTLGWQGRKRKGSIKTDGEKKDVQRDEERSRNGPESMKNTRESFSVSCRILRK